MNDPMSAWTAAMRAEEYEAAWAISEAVLRARDPATRDDPALPYHRRWVWDGRRFDGCDVLVRCYHGLGDTLQFARFLPALAARAASVVVEAPPGLLALLRQLPVEVVPFDPAKPLPPAEREVEITELDFALRLPPGAAKPPYLRAHAAALPTGTVGLCHAGGDWDGERSLPEPALRPLTALAPCVTLRPEPSSLPVMNPQGCPPDIAATADLVAGCTLVITVDTMIAHLAGALGRPCWVLLKADPDWRWDPARRDSAWYPATRLYAQERAGDWTPVIAAVERDMRALAFTTDKGQAGPSES